MLDYFNLIVQLKAHFSYKYAQLIALQLTSSKLD